MAKKYAYKDTYFPVKNDGYSLIYCLSSPRYDTDRERIYLNINEVFHLFQIVDEGLIDEMGILKFTCNILEVKKNQFLFNEGEPGSNLYFILSGKVLISKSNHMGREFSLKICKKNDLCGELILFTDNAAYFFNAKAIENARIAVISKEAFENEVLNNHEQAIKYSIWLTRITQRYATRLCGLIAHGKKGNLYSTLIEMANNFGIQHEDGSITIDHKITNQELAAFCSATRETANIILNELKKEQIIKIDRGRITIIDVEGLKNQLGCAHCVATCCIGS